MGRKTLDAGLKKMGAEMIAPHNPIGRI